MERLEESEIKVVEGVRRAFRGEVLEDHHMVIQIETCARERPSVPKKDLFLRKSARAGSSRCDYPVDLLTEKRLRREALSVHCRGNAVDQDRRALDAYALDFHLEPLWGLDAVAMIQNRALPVACDIQHFLPLKPLIRLHLPFLVEIIVFHPVERLPVSACEIRNLHRHSAELD